jgi:UDP-N-acetylmuramate--alanine ligase
MVERIRQFGHRSATYAGTMDRAVEAILAEARAGDLVLTLGAGNVWQAGDAILAALRERN